MNKISFAIVSLLMALATSLLGCAGSENASPESASSLEGPAFVLFYADN